MTAGIRRIAPSELIRAYAAIKCSPAQVEWIHCSSRTCSPVVALMIYEKKSPAKTVDVILSRSTFEECCELLASELNSHSSYVSGFELGFILLSKDEIVCMGLPPHLINGEEFELGHLDGRTAARAFE